MAQIRTVRSLGLFGKTAFCSDRWFSHGNEQTTFIDLARLAKQKDGSFKTAVELEKGRSYEYRFLINGEKWENDWAAEAYAPTPFGAFNSVVTV